MKVVVSRRLPVLYTGIPGYPSTFTSVQFRPGNVYAFSRTRVYYRRCIHWSGTFRCVSFKLLLYDTRVY